MKVKIHYMRYVAPLLILLVLAAGIAFLWQRQPKQKSDKVLAENTTQSASTNSPEQLEKVQLKNPQDQSVITSVKVSISGKTTPNSYLAILSNSEVAITKTDNNGNFTKEVELTSGLNLIDLKIATLDAKENFTKSLTLWYDKNGQESGSVIYAGNIKNIFDTVITVSTVNAAKNINTTKSTTFDIPTPDEDEQKEATQAAVKNVRVGDFAIGLGDKKDENTITAKKVIIIRENKPKIDKDFAEVKLLTASTKNNFTGKNLKDQKNIEFTLSKNSDIFAGDKDGKAEDIQKDKNALVIYHDQDDKKLVDLIYLLP